MKNNQNQSNYQLRVRNQEKTSKNGDSSLEHIPTVDSLHGSHNKSNDE